MERRSARPPINQQLNEFNAIVNTLDGQINDFIKYIPMLQARPEIHDECVTHLISVLQSYDSFQQFCSELSDRVRRQGSESEARQIQITQQNAKARLQTLITMWKPYLRIDWDNLCQQLDLSILPEPVQTEPENTAVYSEPIEQPTTPQAQDSLQGPSAFSTPICSVNLPPTPPPGIRCPQNKGA